VILGLVLCKKIIFFFCFFVGFGCVALKKMNKSNRGINV
jgi:hypothetical protein